MKLSILFTTALLSISIEAADLQTCIKTIDDVKRLDCFDKFHKVEKEISGNENNGKNPIELVKKQSNNIEINRDTFALLPHKQSYFLPVSYSSDRRQILNNGVTTSDDLTLDDLEVKFQLSFKMNLWDEILGSDTRLMAAYTQKSFWQMYNSELSALFRETNYEPEIFIAKDFNLELAEFTLSTAKLGFIHQSNGRSELFSRSWNRIYADFIFQNKDFVVSFKPWLRVEEDFEDDDNHDIEDYLGHYELGLLYKWHNSEFTALFRNLEANKHSATYQLAWQYPIHENVNIYVEYFNGYGDSLIDYNHRSETFGLGFSVGKWTK